MTADVTDILKAINLHGNQTGWKNNSSKFTKTNNKQDVGMTEDDLDKLFNNAAQNHSKVPSSHKKKPKPNQTLKSNKK